MKMKLRISALALMSWISVTETTRADILPNNWTVNGLDTTGTIFSAGYFVAILYPGISLTQTVNLAAGRYSMSYSGQPAVTDLAPGAGPVVLTPSISSAGTGTPQSTSATQSSPFDLNFFLAAPLPQSADIYRVTKSGAVTISFDFQGDLTCQDGISYVAQYGYCAANFDPNSVSLTPLSLDSLISRLAPNAPVNLQNVAQALDIYTNTPANYPAQFLSLYAVPDTALPTALAQVSGEAATGAQQGAFQFMGQFLGLMVDPFVGGRGSSVGGGALGFAPDRAATLPTDIALAYASALKAPAKAATLDQRWSVWGSAFGGASRTGGNAAVGSNDLDTRAYGFAGGFDYRVTPETSLGFALAGGGTDWRIGAGLGGGRSDTFQAGVYGKTVSGPVYLAASLAFGNYWMSTDRIAFAASRLTSKFEAQGFGGRLEGGYRFAATPSVGITPYAAVQAQSFRTPSYNEVDVNGGGFALGFAGRTATDIRSEIGARFDHLATANGIPVMLRGRLAYAHDWVTDPSLTANFLALPVASFVVNGARAPKDSALASASAEWRLTRQVSLLTKFDGEFSDVSQTFSGTGALRYTW